jgi:superfamily II DNA or RNA helicase
VPNIGLLNQTYKSFVEEFGLKYEQVTTWGDKKLPNLKANILLANNQILLSDVKASVDLLKDFDYVIVDEVHTLGDRTNKINKVIHNIKTPNKFGLSGTLPNDMFACWNILGKIGPILIEESSFSVRQKGTASNVKIMIVYCRHKKIPIVIPTTHNDQPTWEYENECTYIYTHKDRNDLIMELADKAEGNSLILVDKRLHGDALNKYKTKKELYYINGDMPVEERVKITDRMEKQNNIICIAMTQIFSVGISIKNLNNLIFCAIGKSNVRICQSIGRSMRLHENKELAKIFDIADNSKYSRDHLLLRVQIYKEEKIDYKIKTKDLWK